MNTLWYVERAGVIRMGDTNIEIRLMNDWSQPHRYEVRWNERVVDHCCTLDFAKMQAEKWFRDLEEMGFYRG